MMHAVEILNSFEKNRDNSLSNRSISSTILEKKVGFRHEEDNAYNQSMGYSKKGALPPLAVQNNFLSKPPEKSLNRSFNRKHQKMDIVYKKSEDSDDECRPSLDHSNGKFAPKTFFPSSSLLVDAPCSI